MLDVSILIVSYNTRELTVSCLESIYAQTRGIGFEVIVVDNASSDGSADSIASEFPQVRLIRSRENIGFARANNLAADQAIGEYLLLLNPDTIVLDRAINRLHEFAQSNEEYGIYGGRTVFPDGSLNIASCWQRPTPWSLLMRATGLSAILPKSDVFNPEAIGAWKRDTVRMVDIVVGCLFLIRRELWNGLGGFDESYWMYGEESDLCLRAAKLGHRAVICPEATIVHLVGASFDQRSNKCILVAKAKATLVRRHWSSLTRWWGLLMLWCWAASRVMVLVIASAANPRKYSERLQFWLDVWNARHAWLAGYPDKSSEDDQPSLTNLNANIKVADS